MAKHINNPDAPASSKQLFALYKRFGRDFRNLGLSMQEAHDYLSISSGEDVEWSKDHPDAYFGLSMGTEGRNRLNPKTAMQVFQEAYLFAITDAFAGEEFPAEPLEKKSEGFITLNIFKRGNKVGTRWAQTVYQTTTDNPNLLEGSFITIEKATDGSFNLICRADGNLAKAETLALKFAGLLEFYDISSIIVANHSIAA